jgi:hypothetical protein
MVDLHPTLLALLSLPAPAEDAILDGRTLLADRGGRWSVVDDQDRPVIAELVIPERAIARAVIVGESKYIAELKSHAPAERAKVAEAYFDIVTAVAKGESAPQPLWGAPVTEELYDLAEDRGETVDLIAGAVAASDPRLERMREILTRYEQRCREHGLAARQARARQALPTADEIEKLKSLSYL